MRLSIRAVEISAKHRPPGYVEDVIASGQLNGETLTLTDEAFERLSEKYNPEHIGLAALARNFAIATAKWIAAGLPVCERPQFELRLSACQACPHWTGYTCRKCGCTRLKLWLRTERCPIGKWLV